MNPQMMPSHQYLTYESALNQPHHDSRLFGFGFGGPFIGPFGWGRPFFGPFGAPFGFGFGFGVPFFGGFPFFI